MRVPAIYARVVGRLIASFFLLASVHSGVSAQVVPVPLLPQTGSSNPVSAEPPVSRPASTPCVVPLLTNQAFADFSGKPLNYMPPASCPGPWAKVVLTADFTVTAGRQFDRTAEFYLGNANIFYGTTAEPRKALSPSWHVERDLTDLSALFKTAQTGQAVIGNIVNATYTGVIYANAALEFYPATWRDWAPVVPNVVVPVSATNNAGTLNTTSDQITQAVNLPRNVERVYLDVIAQSQSNDEFWYLCVPTDKASALASCGNTSFRETEVTIDGKVAGVAPVYPWIYTGGIDPYLWEPITGVETLDFKPYRVDLTPFAGVLADGAQHTIGIGVFNASSYFLATANLLVYTDHGREQVRGGLLSNTLSAAPLPQVTENLATNASGTTTGTVSVGSNRSFAVRGYVDTSHGRVETTVEQKVSFLNSQTVQVNPTSGPDVQNVVQTSTVDSVTTTRDGSLVETNAKHISYPLALNYAFISNADGTQTQTVTSDQKNLLTETQALNGFRLYEKKVREEVNSTDTLQFDAGGALTAPGVGSATASYRSRDSVGNCYSRSLTAANQKLTAVSDGMGCREEDRNEHQTNHDE